jgi:uncharacterized membrane protein YeaQ/YmgE (transglycosylase-associated protein family)
MSTHRSQQVTTFIAPGTLRPALERASEVVQPDARPYLHTIEAGATLPLFQSLIWGVITGLLAMVISAAYKQTLMQVVLWMIGAFLGGFGIAWMTYQRHWFKLASLEQLLNSDLDGDGVIGEESPQPSIHVRVDEVAVDGIAHHSIYFDLPASEEQMRSLAFGILAGVPFSEGHWTGRNQPFSTRQFRTMRAELIKRGVLMAVNPSAPAQGYQFNAAGRAILRYYCPVTELKGKS